MTIKNDVLTFEYLCEMYPPILEKFNIMVETEAVRSSQDPNYCAIARWNISAFAGYGIWVSQLVGKRRKGEKNKVLESEEAYEIVKSEFMKAMPPCKDVKHNTKKNDD
jgi:hypothetical protein